MESRNELHKKLWAKSEPRHALWCHLLDAATVARALIPRFWPEAPIPEAWLCLIVALHDIGKADPLFQSKAPEAVDVSLMEAGLFDNVDEAWVVGFRHEARSAEWLHAYLQRYGWGPEAISVVTAAVRGHHGNFNPKERLDEHRADWNPLREALADAVHRVLQPEVLFKPQAFENASTTGLFLSGLIVLADWIASGTDPYSYDTLETTEDPAAYFAAAYARATTVVEALALNPTAAAFPGDKPLELRGVWPNLQDLRPSQQALQQSICTGIAPGLAIIEAPMGEGKTESAVYLAEEWHRQRGTSGVYIALPTMATSNQMHDRYTAYLRRRSPTRERPRLVHGMAWLIGDVLPEDAPETDDGSDHDEAAQARMWFASSKRALLSPEGVGTVDQTLMAALLVKYGFLRLFGLSRKVLIVDEVHAYDAYMQTILGRLLRWCCALRIPVILLSATLSRAQKSSLVAAYTGSRPALASRDEPYPLLTFAPLDGQPFAVPVYDLYETKTISVALEPGLLRDTTLTAERAAELVRGGGCVCVLVNTVRRAQETFQALQRMRDGGELADAELCLFHARFPASRRDDIEREVVRRFGPNSADKTQPNPNRPRCAILVATQVVEQSLDVCFDVMLTDLAPIDLLLQRTGRLHRHTVNVRYDHTKPTLYVLLPSTEEPFDFERIELKRGKDGAWHGVYDRAVLLRTLAVLALDKPFSLPDDFRCLIESVYGDSPLDAEPSLVTAIGGAEVAWKQHVAEARGKAKTHLVPKPDPEVFAYAQTKGAVDEAEEGDRTSYFRAQTRLGDDTRAALVLTEENLINAFHNACTKTWRGAREGKRYHPPKTFLQKLFWQKANVPAYWLQATAHEGLQNFVTGSDAPAWLRRHAVVIAPNGEWRGLLSGKPVTLRVEPTLGLSLETTALEGEEMEGVEGA